MSCTDKLPCEMNTLGKTVGLLGHSYRHRACAALSWQRPRSLKPCPPRSLHRVKRAGRTQDKPASLTPLPRLTASALAHGGSRGCPSLAPLSCVKPGLCTVAGVLQLGCQHQDWKGSICASPCAFLANSMHNVSYGPGLSQKMSKLRCGGRWLP